MKRAFRSSVQCGIERGTTSWRGGRQGRGRGTRAQENLMASFEVNKSIISLSVAVMGEVGAQKIVIEITK